MGAGEACEKDKPVRLSYSYKREGHCHQRVRVRESDTEWSHHQQVESSSGCALAEGQRWCVTAVLASSAFSEAHIALASCSPRAGILFALHPRRTFVENLLCCSLNSVQTSNSGMS